MATTHQQYEPSYWTRQHTECVVLDIGGDVGALILYTPPDLHQREIDVSPIGNDRARVHSAVLERSVGGQIVYAAVYPELPEGDYRVWAHTSAPTFSITAGAVTELNLS